MKAVNCLLLIIIFVLLLSCNQDEDEHYRFPLQLGNSWTMRYSLSMFDMNEMRMVNFADTLVITVDSLTVSPDWEECMRVHYQYTGSFLGVGWYEYLVNRADGLYLLGYDTDGSVTPLKNPGVNSPLLPAFLTAKDNTFPEAYWLRYPLLKLPYDIKEGKQWSNMDSHSQDVFAYTLLPQATISTPLGDRKCIRRKTVHVFNTAYDSYSWEYINYFDKHGFVKYIYEEIRHYVDGGTGYDWGDHPYTEQLELLFTRTN